MQEVVTYYSNHTEFYAQVLVSELDTIEIIKFLLHFYA